MDDIYLRRTEGGTATKLVVGLWFRLPAQDIVVVLNMALWSPILRIGFPLFITQLPTRTKPPPHLLTPPGYELMVLDKSGRPQAGRTFSVSAKNRYMSSSSTSVSVTADANGVAKLGHLEDVYEISALTKTFKLSAGSWFPVWI